ncbi:MAG: hypothetical protein IAE89_09505 [Anaerolineae bacterium]|nr:hypothetical protein [Anaerolineae bacterium]
MSTTIIEVGEAPVELTLRQKWSHYFVIIYAILAIIIGVNLRDSAVFATVPYSNPQVGITAFYPHRWMIDSSGDYVFRVRDMAQTGFKTAMQVNIIPVNSDMTTRNILETLILNRSQTDSTFRVLSQEPIQLADNTEATRMTSTFVASNEDPFLESIPTVVERMDVIAVQGGQAIIISFLSDALTFEQNYPKFEQFLNDVDF